MAFRPTAYELERPAKAGVMLYGDTPEGRKLLVAVNEGRFSKNGRYIVLPKGSVDYHKAETPLLGGLREFSEETGFPLISDPALGIEGFLSDAHIEALKRGDILHDVTNPRFPGVIIKKFEPKPYPHTYHARGGKLQTMVMFGIEMQGMDCIQNLKNASGKTTKDYLDANPEIPRFDTFLKWLKQGYIPQDGSLAQLNLCDPEWFKTILPPNGIEVLGDWDKTRENWQVFCHAIEKKPADYEKLRNALSTIKKRMEKKGYIAGDHSVLKFDDKDCPGFWYTEGGVIDFARPIIAKTLADMETNADYARAFGGEGTKFTNLRKSQIRQLGQVAGFTPFVSGEDWRGACIDAMGKAGRMARAFVTTGLHQQSAAKPTHGLATGQTAR